MESGRNRDRREAAPRSRLAMTVTLLGVAAMAIVTVWLVSGLRGVTPAVVSSMSIEDGASESFSSEVATIAAEAEGPVPLSEDPVPPKAQIPMARAVIAWQPSHQGDTGYDGWREYEICGDIMERTISKLTDFEHVRAWTLDHGLTGRNSYRPNPLNTEAFDVEIGIANDAGADVFISIHNDGGAPSGVLGMCMPGDAASRALCESIVAQISAETGLPNRGIREERLYSLEPEWNEAPLRLLLEIGDNVRDREFLETPDRRGDVAAAIAAAVRAWEW